MPTARAQFSTAVVNGKIYPIGGFTGVPFNPIPTVEEYNPATDKWTKKADMPTARILLSTSVVNGKIYAIGGVTIPLRDWETVKQVDVYHPAKETWTKESDMPTRRGWHSASAVKGKIYVIGGASRHMPDVWPAVPLSTVEAYDTGLAVSPQGKLPTLWGLLKVWERFTARR